jgi:hypothetical protein
MLEDHPLLAACNCLYSQLPSTHGEEHIIEIKTELELTDLFYKGSVKKDSPVLIVFTKLCDKYHWVITTVIGDCAVPSSNIMKQC